MKLCKAAASMPALSSACKTGLSGLKQIDRKRIDVDATSRVSGSIDLDAALCDEMPNDPRWDYVVGYRHEGSIADYLYWIEVHPATSGEVKSVLSKLSWLKMWLEGTGEPLNGFGRQFVWIASGEVRLSPSSPERKRLAQNGILFPGRILKIPHKRK